MAARIASVSPGDRRRPAVPSPSGTSTFSSTVIESKSPRPWRVRETPRPTSAVGADGRRAPVDVDAAARTTHEPAHGVEDRGLAGAVRTDEGEGLAVGDLERDVVEGGQAAEGDGEPADPQPWRWCVHRHLFVSWWQHPTTETDQTVCGCCMRPVGRVARERSEQAYRDPRSRRHSGSEHPGMVSIRVLAALGR